LMNRRCRICNSELMICGSCPDTGCTSMFPNVQSLELLSKQLRFLRRVHADRATLPLWTYPIEKVDHIIERMEDDDDDGQ
jgi:hypothetical protein